MQNGRSVLDDYGIQISDLTPMLEDWVLVGSEGEGEEGGASGSGKTNGGANGDGSSGGSDQGSGGNGEGSGDGSGGNKGDAEGAEGSGGDGDTFDRAYVEKLRKEAADYRTRAKAAEDELNEKKKEEMSELEKAQTEAEEFQARADALETQLDGMRLQMAVAAEATAQFFHDPEDALSLIDRDSISKNDEGVYNKQSVQAAVKRLADSKPHLVKGKSAGSGDGGARGQGGGNMTEQERQEQLAKEYAERGGVPIPKL